MRNVPHRLIPRRLMLLNVWSPGWRDTEVVGIGALLEEVCHQGSGSRLHHTQSPVLSLLPVCG